MGCSSSVPLDPSSSQPQRVSSSSSSNLVSLCRDRLALLRAAADRRFALADAHAAYFRQLAAVGAALFLFAEEELVEAPTGSPVISLPPSGGKSAKASSEASVSTVTPLSHSPAPSGEAPERLISGGGSGNSPDAAAEEEDVTGTSNPRYFFMDPNFQYEHNMFQNPFWHHGDFDPYGPWDAAATRPPPPPPPPRPPGSANLDYFFNPFKAYEDENDGDEYGYGAVSIPSSPHSDELRPQEGIPDLEDEGEPVRDAPPAVSDPGPSSRRRVVTPQVMNEGSVPAPPDPGRLSPLRNDLAPQHSSLGLMGMVKEVHDRFADASKCATEVAETLEVGKMRYGATPRALRYISSRIVEPLTLQVSTTSCVPRRSRNRASGPSTQRPSADGTGASTSARNSSEIDMERLSENLSTTLEKLCAWETLLYQNVKDEEKLQDSYKKQQKQLLRLVDSGAELSVIDSTHQSVKKLQSKINVVIRSIKSISRWISAIRDGELQPQLVTLIKGLRETWEELSKLHKMQLSAMLKFTGDIRANTWQSSQHPARTATENLEKQLKKWRHCFDQWIGVQKSFAEALNDWLRKWIRDPTPTSAPAARALETEDGPRPYSPGKLHAPSAFVMANDWDQVMGRLLESAAPASNALAQFISAVHQFKLAQEEEHRQRLEAEYYSRAYENRREVLRSKIGVGCNLDPHDERAVHLRSVRKRRDEEAAEHKRAAKLVHGTAAGTLKDGMRSALMALADLSHAGLVAYEMIRTPVSEGIPTLPSSEGIPPPPPLEEVDGFP